MLRMPAFRILSAAVVIGIFSAYLAASEPAFVGPQLNRGIALALASVGVVLALLGATVKWRHQNSWLGNALVTVAAAVLIGAAAGWLWRAGQPAYFVG